MEQFHTYLIYGRFGRLAGNIYETLVRPQLNTKMYPV